MGLDTRNLSEALGNQRNSGSEKAFLPHSVQLHLEHHTDPSIFLFIYSLTHSHLLNASYMQSLLAGMHKQPSVLILSP